MVTSRLKNQKNSLEKVLLELSLTKQNNSLPMLKNAAQPILFLCGERDKKYLTLYKNLPTSVMQDIIPGAGHAIHIEHPKMCAEKINHFHNEVNYVKHRMERLFSI